MVTDGPPVRLLRLPAPPVLPRCRLETSPPPRASPLFTLPFPLYPPCLQAAEYHKLLVQRLKEQRERRSESLAKKRAMRMASVASKEA